MPTVTPEDSYENVRSRVRGEIDAYFKITLNRPEILNRIGENIIIFDFIRADVTEQILSGMVASVLADLTAAQGLEVRISDGATAALRTCCLRDLSNGGRGIRNQVEAHLLNPLAPALFDHPFRVGDRIEIASIEPGHVTTLTLAPLERSAP